MSFLEKIKNLFAENKSLQTLQAEENIPLKDLQEKIEKEINQIIIELSKKEKALLPLLQNSLSNLQSLNAALKSYSLEEKKEPEKIKIIVEQNKNYYASLLDSLIKKVSSILPSDENITKKISNLFYEISGFEKRSLNNYEKATILIGEEIQQTKIEIKNIFSLCQNFIKQNEILLNKKSLLEDSLQKIREINEKVSIEEQNSLSLSALTKNSLALESQQKELNEKIFSLKGTDPYNQLLSLQSEISSISILLEKNEEKIKSSINSKILESYLYQQPTKEKKLLAEKYLSSPVRALLDDTDLLLLSFFSQVKEDLEKGLIRSDPKKRSRLLSQIILDKNHFLYLKEELLSLKEKQDAIYKEISSLQLSLDLGSLEAQLFSLKELSAKAKKEIKIKEANSSRLEKDIQEEVSSLQNMLSIAFDKKIILSP